MDHPREDDDAHRDAPEALLQERPVDGADAAVGLELLASSLPVDHSGTTVHIQAWCVLKSSKPPILVVHDLGERSEHYRAAAEGFAAAGYSVYAFDLRGHGRSGRRLGHAPSFDHLVKDLLQVAAWVRHKEDGREPVILGNGVGALILMEFTKQYGSLCRAAILAAPCLELAAEATAVKRLVVRMLADLFPFMRLPHALCPRFVRDARDSTRARDAARITATLAHELLLALKRAETKFIEYHGAVLILCPERDTVCHYHRLKKAAALHAEHNVVIAELAEANHAVFTGNEAIRAAALAVILPWLETSLSAAAAAKDQAGNRRHGAAARADKPGATKS